MSKKTYRKIYGIIASLVVTGLKCFGLIADWVFITVIILAWFGTAVALKIFRAIKGIKGGDIEN